MSELIFDSYGKNSNKNDLVLKIIYRKKKNDKVRIFGKNFVRRNKNRYKIIYQNKEH